MNIDRQSPSALLDRFLLAIAQLACRTSPQRPRSRRQHGSPSSAPTIAMVNADVPSTTAATARRPIAAPLSPPFPVRQAPPSTTTMTSSRRPTSSLTVVQRDSDPVPSSSRPLPGSGSGARLSPADFAAAQREAAARVAAKEEARYEALRRESERRAVESLKVVDLVALLSEPGVSREVMKDVVRRSLRPKFFPRLS